MKKSKKMLIIFLVGFIVGVIGFVGSFLMYIKPEPISKEENNTGDKKEIITGSIVFNSIDDSLYLDSAIPTLDKFGVQEKGFNFSIKNTTDHDMNYQLSLVDDNSTIKNSFIRYELTKNNVVLGIFTLSDDGIIEKSNMLNHCHQNQNRFQT